MINPNQQKGSLNQFAGAKMPANEVTALYALSPAFPGASCVGLSESRILLTSAPSDWRLRVRRVVSVVCIVSRQV